jgi:GNAT superfamily N-acetyltransferase
MHKQPHARHRLDVHPRRARPQDATVLAPLFAAAFLDDPAMEWVARAGSSRRRGLESFFFRFLGDRAIPAGEVFMTDDASACAIWLPPGVPAWPAGVVSQLQSLPLFLQVCGLGRLARGAALSARMERAHPRESHFYLPFIAVAPRFQGQGLGSAVLNASLQHVDRAGMPAYLENSNPKNAPLYERAGFVARDNIAPRGAPPLIPMWRARRHDDAREGPAA